MNEIGKSKYELDNELLTQEEFDKEVQKVQVYMDEQLQVKSVTVADILKAGNEKPPKEEEKDKEMKDDSVGAASGEADEVKENVTIEPIIQKENSISDIK